LSNLADARPRERRCEFDATGAAARRKGARIFEASKNDEGNSWLWSLKIQPERVRAVRFGTAHEAERAKSRRFSEQTATSVVATRSESPWFAKLHERNHNLSKNSLFHLWQLDASLTRRTRGLNEPPTRHDEQTVIKMYF